MRPRATFLAAILSVVASFAAAQSPTVVELFTSQGCSSCPPADKLFHELAARDDVIALSLHVDYWDYIGWKDQFADPRNADRQRGYAVAGQRRSIYTPQMIVNGMTDIVGTRPMELAKAIMDHSADKTPVSVSLSRDGDMVTVHAVSEKDGDMVLHMLRYWPSRTIKIKRGENAGRTLNYANVTYGWTVLGNWSGAEDARIDVAVEGDDPVVVLVQDHDHGRILAAARLR